MGRKLAARTVRGGLAIGLLVLSCVLVPASSAALQANPADHRSPTTAAGSAPAARAPLRRSAALPTAVGRATPTHPAAPDAARPAIVLAPQAGDVVEKAYPPRLPPPSGVGTPTGPQVQPAPMNGGVTVAPRPARTPSPPSATTLSAPAPSASSPTPVPTSSPVNPTPPSVAAERPTNGFSGPTGELIALLIGFTLAIAAIVLIAGYRGRAH
jgi:hypothetical protein